MKIMNQLFCLFFIFMSFLIKADQKPKVSIQLFGKKNQILINKPKTQSKLRFSKMDWMKEKKKFTLAINGTEALSSEWKEYTFTFMPSKSGNIKLTLLGTFHKPAGAQKPLSIFVCYDAFVVTGAELKNTSFESLNPKGLPFWWWGASTDQILSNGAKEGQNFIAVSQNKRVSQNLIIKANQLVTIKFSARSYPRSI
jgi:hypothetical protein